MYIVGLDGRRSDFKDVPHISSEGLEKKEPDNFWFSGTNIVLRRLHTEDLNRAVLLLSKNFSPIFKDVVGSAHSKLPL